MAHPSRAFRHDSAGSSETKVLPRGVRVFGPSGEILFETGDEIPRRTVENIRDAETGSLRSEGGPALVGAARGATAAWSVDDQLWMLSWPSRRVERLVLPDRSPAYPSIDADGRVWVSVGQRHAVTDQLIHRVYEPYLSDYFLVALNNVVDAIGHLVLTPRGHRSGWADRGWHTSP